jgi:hypothetical protein
MRWPSWRQWLVMSAFGAAPVLGCNHAEHHCNCASTLRSPGPVVMLPAPTAETSPLKSPEPASKAQMASTQTDTMVQPAAAKRPESAFGTVAVPIVAGSELGSRTGTFLLTAADAEAMGVKPGYTPGAIIMPPK